MKKSIAGLDLEYPDDGTIATMTFPQMNDVEKITFFKALLKGGGTFLDVGAHAGGIGLAVAAETSAQVHLFEPNAALHPLIERNIEANAARFKVQPILHRYAISDFDDDEASFSIARDGTQDSRLIRQRRKNVKPLPNRYDEQVRPLVEVKVRMLDTLLRGLDLPRPLVVKVDAQGSDMAVLRGAGQVAPDFVIAELWPYGLLRTGESPGSTLDTLMAFRGGMVFSSISVRAQEDWHTRFAAGLPWRDAAAGNFVDFFDLYLVR